MEASEGRASGSSRGGKAPRTWSLDGWPVFRHGYRPLNVGNRAILENVEEAPRSGRATPLRSRRIKRAQRLRCGLQDAIDRKKAPEPPPEA